MKKLWVGSGIVVGICLLAIVLSYVFRSGPDPLRVSTDASTSFSASVQTIPLGISNLTDAETGFIRKFELQQEKDGVFTTLPGTSGEGDEVSVDAQDTKRTTVELQPFGTLEPGRYRFRLRGTDGKTYLSNVFVLDDTVTDVVVGTVEKESISLDDIRAYLQTATLSATVMEEDGIAYSVRASFENYLSSWSVTCQAEVGLQRYEEDGDIWIVNQASVQSVSLEDSHASFYLPLTGVEKEGMYRVYLCEMATGTSLYSDTFTITI